MRILITGSRYFTNTSMIRQALKEAIGDTPCKDVVVVHGAAKGADSDSGRIARELGARVEEHPADWSQGRSAGPARNRKMVSLGADVCLAFLTKGAKNAGTLSCVRYAKEAGIPTKVFESESVIDFS